MLTVDSVSELSRDIVFGQQCPRVSRRLHRAQRSLAATLPLSRVSFAYVVAPCTLPSKWWGRILKHRISSVPQRTCVQGRTTKRVMVSSAPSGIMLHVVVIHASSFRVSVLSYTTSTQTYIHTYTHIFVKLGHRQWRPFDFS